jgi:Ca2+-binding RTX toxin-like protein
MDFLPPLLLGLAGDDAAYGGVGDDTIDGGDANDTIAISSAHGPRYGHRLRGRRSLVRR